MAVIFPIPSSYSKLDGETRLHPYVQTNRRSARLSRAAALIAADFFAFAVAFAVAACIAQLANLYIPRALLPAEYVNTAILYDTALLAGVMLYFGRHAHYTRRRPFWSATHNVMTASVIALLCSGFWHFSTQRGESRLLLEVPWVIFPTASIVARILARKILQRVGLWELRVVVIGEGPAACQAEAALLSEPGLGYDIAGVVAQSALGMTTDDLWRGLLRQHRAEMVILLKFGTQDPQTSAITQSLLRQRIPFAVMPQLGGLPVLGLEQTNFFSHDTVMFSFNNSLARPMSRVTKLLFDIAGAFVLLTATAPVLLTIAAAIKLDGGPIFYAQRRIGAGGREFNCLKFRSMVPEADDVLRRILVQDLAAALEWKATHKLRDDPRVTPIGRFLRRTSLDELPQLFNVLRLEMSLVGPRPIVQSEVVRYGEDFVSYCETRPGVTGLWQVSGRSDTSYDQRVQLDTWYVKNWTLWHDVAILAKTVPAVLQGRGAV